MFGFRFEPLEGRSGSTRVWLISVGSETIERCVRGWPGAGSSLREEEYMSDLPLLDVTGRRRSPTATPGVRCGRVPPNKGLRYPPDPPRAEEIILVMRQAGQTSHGLRIRALIAVLWRGGLRISEALALAETDVDKRRGALSIRHGKGDRRREVGMDDWGFDHLDAWLQRRVHMPVGPLFCVIDGSTCGRPWASTAVRAELRRLAADAGVRRRFAPHQLRHGHAVELAREGVPVNIIQRQLGHTDLGTTSTYLQGIDPSEILDAIHVRRQPTISASAGLNLYLAALRPTTAGTPPLPLRPSCRPERKRDQAV
jgi:integrase